MAVLSFKFDESYDKRCMCVGGWVGEESEWRRLENQWQKRIDFQNARALPNQQIERFHATRLNGYSEEYANWNSGMSAMFCGKLVRMLIRRKMGFVCCGVDLDALDAVFPESAPVKMEDAYALCIKQTMVDIARIMRVYRPTDEVMLIHDHGSWNLQALKAYNSMVDDERWPARKYFHSISPLTWKQSVGLQAADLIAYEGFKVMRKRLIHNSSELRWALREFIAKEVPAAAKYMDKSSILELRTLIESSNI